MEVITAPIYVKLTEEERKTLRDAYDIFNELYDIIANNDCECAINILTNESYNSGDIVLAANILRTFASADKLEISK